MLGACARDAKGKWTLLNVSLKGKVNTVLSSSLQIPFAINDANGTWRVQVRDVTSALTATTSVVRA